MIRITCTKFSEQCQQHSNLFSRANATHLTKWSSIVRDFFEIPRPSISLHQRSPDRGWPFVKNRRARPKSSGERISRPEYLSRDISRCGGTLSMEIGTQLAPLECRNRQVETTWFPSDFSLFVRRSRSLDSLLVLFWPRESCSEQRFRFADRFDRTRLLSRNTWAC